MTPEDVLQEIDRLLKDMEDACRVRNVAYFTPVEQWRDRLRAVVDLLRSQEARES